MTVPLRMQLLDEILKTYLPPTNTKISEYNHSKLNVCSECCNQLTVGSAQVKTKRYNDSVL